MPNIDPVVKAWELDLAARLGQAVQTRRNALGLTAQQLAQRTADLGYPITRVAISKIEGNKRAGKVDVAELIVLAKALEMPPVLLLYPGFPEGYDARVDIPTAHDFKTGSDSGGEPAFSVSFPAEVETLPGQRENSRDAVLWFSGHLPSMWHSGGGRIEDEEVRQKLGASIVQSDALALETEKRVAAQRSQVARDGISEAEAEQTRRLMQHDETLIARVRHSMKNDQDRLWGAWEERQERSRQYLRSRGVEK
ncbi:MAG: helix-turn-helix domain-containing protein [Actinomycetia bacterium]|nr:helix-turn-helix domain-containing protein [Actinomycetes bacterium]MCH9759192.1 helix-turn-helix domain-containing protein [Actinomycetes bacterium]